jgi:hypothetical protein
VTTPNGWDPVARGSDGAALSAGELCTRDGCWHRWLDHDHIDAPLWGQGWGWCMVRGGDGRCSCVGFLTGTLPVLGPTAFAAPFPPEPPARHGKPE